MGGLFRRAEERAASGWDEWFAGGDAPGTNRAATGLVPFYAAVRHIVDFMSTLPIDAYRKTDDVREPAPLPALFRRLDEPGDRGIPTWIGQWAYGLAVHGNSVGWIVDWDGYGYPTIVRWLSRDAWSFDESAKQWYVSGQPVPSQMIVHSPWIVPNGKTIGMSPLEHFQEFWKAGLSAQQYADVSRGGGVPPAHLKNTAKTLDADEASGVQARAVRSFASGKPFVTGNDWDLDITTIPPNQAQFLNTLQLTANQTAAIFGLDPREIGGSATESLTYATDESRSLNRANNMRPYLFRFEHMTARLLPERQYIRLNVDATIRTDIKTRTEVVGAKLKDGRMNVDEARALEDEPPLPNGQGQRYNVPAPTAEPTQRKDAS
tara:strand:- start:1054 stop:2184 length:1131 start_codon:yes stop_codon:yes gene_type:complete